MIKFDDINVTEEFVEKLNSEELNKLGSKLVNAGWKLRQMARDCEIEEMDIDFLGKYVKCENIWGNEIWLHVSEQFNSTKDNDDTHIYLRGLGFKFCFSEYRDDTYVTYDEWIDAEVDLDDYLDGNTELIQEVTKEEFQNKFAEVMKQSMENFKELELNFKLPVREDDDDTEENED